MDIRYFDCFKSNFKEFSCENFHPSRSHNKRSPWLLNQSNLEREKAKSRGYINFHPFEKQLKIILPPKTFPFCVRGWCGGGVCSENGRILHNFNEFLGTWAGKFLQLFLPSLSNKCSQQGASDGFHVQKDKFSSVCINYVSFFIARDAERAARRAAQTYFSTRARAFGGVKVLQSFCFFIGHTAHRIRFLQLVKHYNSLSSSARCPHRPFLYEDAKLSFFQNTQKSDFQTFSLEIMKRACGTTQIHNNVCPEENFPHVRCFLQELGKT